jgi:hypothetical protein
LKLARKSSITHPLGVVLETPLLVPSFSSKGFLFKKTKTREISEVTDFMEVSAEVLTESMLVSAYDLHHKHIQPSSRIAKIAPVIFIDSGGYEVSDTHDFPAVYKHPPLKDVRWTEDHLRKVMKAWPKRSPAVFVSFDNTGRSFPQQFDAARKLFASIPDQLHDLILKPHRRGRQGQYIDIPSLLPHVKEIASFDVVGFTEKDLGDSVLNRMLSVGRLRRALDTAGVMTPIHVFGSLDPLSSSLYFLAGGEIFDGLTWLRYSYSAGQAVYYHNHGVINYGIHERDSLVNARSLRENVYYLQRLKYQMLDFLGKRSFKKFEFYREVLEKSYETFLTQLGGRD